MTELTPSTEKRLRSRVSELRERVREHEGLVRALQAGEVDAVVVLQEDDTTISRLQTDEPLYRTMVDVLPQGVATVLSDGTIVYLNHHLAALLGAAASAMLGRNLLTSLADFDRTRFAAMLQRALVSPQESGFAFTWATEQAPALVSAIRLPASGSDAIGLVIVDVRDQVARRAAEESSRAKDELLASVSHELRTPLTSIMGWIQYLEVELKNETTVQPALRNLKAAVMAETKIVDDLLDLARSEKGSLPLAMEEFDLCDTIRMAASFVEVQATSKRLALNAELPDCPLQVRGDPNRLRQVFLNLLSNAVKFTPSGEVCITARQEDRTIVVDVADSGIGILSDFLPLVFEPFRRSDRAQGYPGLGIGMAISRRIIEAHSGTISVISEGIGKGATFTVRIPMA
jgi:PAS domain S-box-containing protein